MTELTKTERKLLDKLINNISLGRNRAGYDGTREASAARKLEDRGLVIKHITDGTYYRPRRDGRNSTYYQRAYHPQGTIEVIDIEALKKA